MRPPNMKLRQQTAAADTDYFRRYVAEPTVPSCWSRRRATWWSLSMGLADLGAHGPGGGEADAEKTAASITAR
jgi:hypothetical protein